ncbi:MAG: hypothetical protein AB1714_14395 [Acidobacteriota bacterium]
MTLADVRDILRAEILWANDLTTVVESVGAADLMSDVLALSRPGMLLLSGLLSVQTIRTAAVADLIGVVFVRGKIPDSQIVRAAEEAGVPIMSTAFTMFEASGLLYCALNRR